MSFVQADIYGITDGQRRTTGQLHAQPVIGYIQSARINLPTLMHERKGNFLLHPQLPPLFRTMLPTEEDPAVWTRLEFFNGSAVGIPTALRTCQP